MPSAFDADFEAADDLFAEAFGVSVVIRRSDSDSGTVTAEVVIRDYTVFDQDGLHTVAQYRDYLIAASDYDFGSGAATPRPGDRISETIGSVACTFELMPIGTRPAGEWADVNGTRWLVHTKKVA